MAAPLPKMTCILCQKITLTYICPGCSKHFCFNHLSEHRTSIERQFDHLQNDHDLLREEITGFKNDPTKHVFLRQIDQWETDSLNKIKLQAKLCRIEWISYSKTFVRQLEKKLNHLAQQIKNIHQENAFNEFDFNRLKQTLERLRKELNQPSNVSIKQQSTSFIDKISLVVPSEKDIRWKQFATTIVGNNHPGDRLDQLNGPQSIFVDDQNQLIYIADRGNHRIVEWNLDTNNGQIVAGGNGQGNQLDQLNEPSDVIIDRQSNDLIIADRGNRRVMRWSRRMNSPPQIMVDDIDCLRLTIHEDGTFYVSDYKKNQVKRWRKGEIDGTIVAGGNGQGSQLNQLDHPTFLFVDDNHNLYISDVYNHRVMKWTRDAKEGIVVAGGNGRGDQLTQLFSPEGVTVDQSGQIYIADFGNDRVVRWCAGKREGTIVVGGTSKEQGQNQLNGPFGLSFDGEGNLYVADRGNHRIEKFDRD